MTWFPKHLFVENSLEQSIIKFNENYYMSIYCKNICSDSSINFNTHTEWL